MNIQALIDGLNAQWQQERSKSQMTLGKLIDRLKEMPQDFELDGFGEPHSYRGYYSDLAFEKVSGKITVGKALEMAKDCMGEVFEGYKGGDFQMGRNTPVWISDYGTTGDKLMSIEDDGSLVLEEEKFDY